MPRFQQHLFETVNSKKNAGLLYAFVSRSLVNDALKNSLNAARSIYDADELSIIDAYENARSLCSDAQGELMRGGTIYSADLIASVPDSVMQELDNEIAKLQLAQPARLQLVPIKKKYPLHIVGTDIDIRTEVRNSGGGTAFDVQVAIQSTDELDVANPSIYIGTVHANDSRIVQFEARVMRPESLALVSSHIEWSNFDRKGNGVATDFELEAQDPSIDWALLESSQPYALDVALGARFVGRTHLLSHLIRHVSNQHPSSFYLWGQKRVGKTSLVRTLADSLERTSPELAVVYLETITELTADQTTNAMCRRLIARLRTTDRRFHSVAEPEYVGTLSPLMNYLDQLMAITPEKKFLIIIDEFDELPIELYKGRGVADSFFQMLGKGIAGKVGVGVILVGGERIAEIKRAQGMRLNMYRPQYMDHFERNEEFNDLIRRPGFPLEFSDDAIDQLWNYSTGHPFFLNEICSRLAEMMIERRDAYATRVEVDQAIVRTLNTIDVNSFAHYWADGIIEADHEQSKGRIVDRTRFLAAAAEALAQGEGIMSKDLLTERARSRGCTLASVDHLIREFLLRRILIEKDKGYQFRVRLFQEWLCDRGVIELEILLWDDLNNSERMEEERSALVTEDEIEELIGSWGTYQGERLSSFKVRQWLAQFNGRHDQRLMFRLLQNIQFYHGEQIRNNLQRSHRAITATLVTQIKTHREHRRDFLVSYLGSLGKSGAWMARLYRQSNEIWNENCLEIDKIYQKLVKDLDIRIIVFVDDFVGTGRTAISQFNDFFTQNPQTVEVVKERKIDIWYLTVAGTSEGLRSLRHFFETASIPVKVIAADELESSAKAFAPESPIWVDAGERDLAREIAKSFGERLEGRAPLGFGDNQGLVVFETNCPNTSLPILYKRRKALGEVFQPLFPRSS